jgi:hypothetical protein
MHSHLKQCCTVVLRALPQPVSCSAIQFLRHQVNDLTPNAILTEALGQALPGSQGVQVVGPEYSFLTLQSDLEQRLRFSQPALAADTPGKAAGGGQGLPAVLALHALPSF